MSVLYLNVCRLCVPNITSLATGYMFLKLHLVKVGCLLDTASKFMLFLVSG